MLLQPSSAPPSGKGRGVVHQCLVLCQPDVCGWWWVQGYKKVGVSAALNTGQSVLEICGSIVVLVLVEDSALKRLTSLGLVSLAAAALSAIIGMSLVA